MRGPQAGGRVHMVCPRLLELDPRHGEHGAGLKYPVPFEHAKDHDRDCGCLVDTEGHRAVTVIFPPGSELADDHPDLTCTCGRRLVVGEWH